MASSSDPIILAIIAVSILLLGAKLLAELFARLNLPVVLGELTAGIILGPFYFGGLVQIQPNLVEVNDIVLAFAQLGGIVILFVAGLGMPLRDFVKSGAASFTTGTMGVLLPFFGGLLLFAGLGFARSTSLMVDAALTATSIAISIETLRDVGHLNTPEGKLVVGAAVVDDVLAIAVLSVVVSLISNTQGPIGFLDITYVIGGVLFLFGVLLGISVLIGPRLTEAKFWRTSGSVDTVVTAHCFGVAALAAATRLSRDACAFAARL